MKKYTIQQVAKLLADKTHAVYCDVNEFELLRKILKLAFPNDEETDKFEYEMNCNYGFCMHDSHNWANVGEYLKELSIINLSDIFNLKLKENKDSGYFFKGLVSDIQKIQDTFYPNVNDIRVNEPVNIQYVSISKEDYDRFLKLGNKSKKSDQKFLDKCAIGAMNGLIITEKHSADYVVSTSYKLANEMLNERNKNK